MPPTKRQPEIVDRELKIYTRDSPQTGVHTTASEQQPYSWANLPAPALENILEKLADADRFSMAQVCKAWYQGFRDPAIWRRRIIVFHDTAFKLAHRKFGAKTRQILHRMSGKEAIICARTFPIYFQEVEIYFSQTSMENAKDFSIFSKLLYEAKLTQIRLNFLFLENEHKHFIKPLLKLIQKQKNLKEFRISSFMWDLKSGVELLKHLTDVNGTKLQRLYLDYPFMFKIPSHRVGPITEEIKKFYNLVNIKLNNEWISEDLVKHWSERCPSLAVIKLLISERAHVISDEAWRDLVRTHPALIVEMDFAFSKHFDKKRRLAVLSQAVPLYKLTWNAEYETLSELEITSFLRRLPCYHKTLTHLYLICSVTGYPDPTQVYRILSKCENLRPYTIKIDDLNHWEISQELS